MHCPGTETGLKACSSSVTDESNLEKIKFKFGTCLLFKSVSCKFHVIADKISKRLQGIRYIHKTELTQLNVGQNESHSCIQATLHCFNVKDSLLKKTAHKDSQLRAPKVKQRRCEPRDQHQTRTRLKYTCSLTLVLEYLLFTFHLLTQTI